MPVAAARRQARGAPLKLSAQGIFGFRVTVAINSAAQFVLARRTY
jgi:hypothetical protein